MCRGGLEDILTKDVKNGTARQEKRGRPQRKFVDVCIVDVLKEDIWGRCNRRGC